MHMLSHWNYIDFRANVFNYSWVARQWWIKLNFKREITFSSSTNSQIIPSLYIIYCILVDCLNNIKTSDLIANQCTRRYRHKKISSCHFSFHSIMRALNQIFLLNFGSTRNVTNLKIHVWHFRHFRMVKKRNFGWSSITFFKKNFN